MRLFASDAVAEHVCCGLDYTQRLASFALFFASGLLCLFLSSLELYALLLGSSHKFALMYTLANVLLLTSTMFLVGPQQQLSSMFESKRYWASIAYGGSMTLTVYVSLSMPTVFLLAPLLLVQGVSMAWYVLTYLPWGAQLAGMLGRGVRSSLV